MLSNLKGKLQNVQQDITTSLKNLQLDRRILRLTAGSNTKALRILRPRSKKPNLNKDPNFAAALKLLEYYNNIWAGIHAKTEETARSAEAANKIITDILTNYERALIQMQKMSSALAFIPKLLHGVEQISDHILNVQCAFDETEEALLVLEDMIETQDLREKELEHRFQLALYQTKRAAELDDLKEKFTNDHFVKVKEHEKRMSSNFKERQAGFQEAFEQDLQQYKEGNLVARKQTSSNSTASSTPLEEIELEEDPYFLEDFLSDDLDKNSGKCTL